jgi:hypothetical protein
VIDIDRGDPLETYKFPLEVPALSEYINAFLEWNLARKSIFHACSPLSSSLEKKKLQPPACLADVGAGTSS